MENCKHKFTYTLFDKDGNKINQTIVRDKKGKVIAEENTIVVTCSECGFTHVYEHEEN